MRKQQHSDTCNKINDKRCEAGAARGHLALNVEDGQEEGACWGFVGGKAVGASRYNL
jgi:hypothetical protein